MSKVQHFEAELGKLSSEELRQIRDWLDEILEDEIGSSSEFQTTASQGEQETHESRLSELRAEVERVCAECSGQNWDGYDALPVSAETRQAALRFATVWPVALPKPEVSAAPNGDVSFEWAAAPDRLFTVGVNSAGELAYASLWSGLRAQGTEILADTIPPVVLAHVRRIALEPAAR
ncbi:MAG: hypothetical protein L0Z50_19420 [Verrucomicrobiales bacterium]|nr:hypothetical protein [Verrucomicrobiales bacterium]